MEPVERGEEGGGAERWERFVSPDLKPETRDAFGRLSALLPRYGLSKREFRHLPEAGHYDIPESTRHCVATKFTQHGVAYKRVKLYGAKFSLGAAE